jgi:serine protease Do
MEKSVMWTKLSDHGAGGIPAKAIEPTARAIIAWYWTGVVAMALIVFSGVAQARTAPESFAGLAARLLPAVVNISTTQVIRGRNGPELPKLPPGSPFEEFFKKFHDRNGPQRERRATSLGSGFIIDPAGYVVTNNHVIEGADEITVILQDDSRLTAKLVGRDAKTDIAVLKVMSEGDLPSVGFGDSDAARVGDWVVAIGNPFGLGGTVTAGIVSARGRDINAGPYDDFIQTDASINRGNSGGPMFDLNGDVIGINTAIYSPSGGSVGIGFAIPSAVTKGIVKQLIEFGRVRRGWLGVQIQQVTDEIAETLGLEEASGALVAGVVKHSPAEMADIQAGDVILEFDGRAISEMRRLPRVVAETVAGKDVEVVLWRRNRVTTVTVNVGELEKPEEQAAVMPDDGDQDAADREIGALGLTLSSLTPRLRERLELASEVTGVVITGVDESSVAAERGISAGDLIVEIDRESATSPSHVATMVEKALEARRPSALLLLDGRRGLRFVALPLA